ncbi:hypothetical protein COO60DRAFT_1626390 [Scenedesmus sp. NREL 46B-D3]|nr:hypothetical protein COO60DRAFT_1626390 [Scenedesmus sp. NREL 46B-D3]
MNCCLWPLHILVCPVASHGYILMWHTCTALMRRTCSTSACCSPASSAHAALAMPADWAAACMASASGLPKDTLPWLGLGLEAVTAVAVLAEGGARKRLLQDHPRAPRLKKSIVSADCSVAGRWATLQAAMQTLHFFS